MQSFFQLLDPDGKLSKAGAKGGHLPHNLGVGAVVDVAGAFIGTAKRFDVTANVGDVVGVHGRAGLSPDEWSGSEPFAGGSGWGVVAAGTFQRLLRRSGRQRRQDGSGHNRYRRYARKEASAGEGH
jgi:hypothetical protein